MCTHTYYTKIGSGPNIWSKGSNKHQYSQNQAVLSNKKILETRWDIPLCSSNNICSYVDLDIPTSFLDTVFLNILFVVM